MQQIPSNRRSFLLRTAIVIASITMLVAVAIGCHDSNNQSGTGGDDRPPLVPSTAPQSDQPGDKPAPVDHTVSVYSVSEDKDGALKLEPKQVTLSGEDAKTPAAFALKALIDDAKSPLPKGTTLRSIKIDSGTATVDFSKELKDNFPGGDQAEALIINAVLATLGQFKSVKNVQFLIDGKKVDSLGGTQTLDEPLPVPQAGSAPAPSGGGEGG